MNCISAGQVEFLVQQIWEKFTTVAFQTQMTRLHSVRCFITCEN